MSPVVTGMGVEVGAQAARSRALAVLRIRSRALAVALLPAAVAVVLLAGGATGPSRRRRLGRRALDRDAARGRSCCSPPPASPWSSPAPGPP